MIKSKLILLSLSFLFFTQANADALHCEELFSLSSSKASVLAGVGRVLLAPVTFVKNEKSESDRLKQEHAQMVEDMHMLSRVKVSEVDLNENYKGIEGNASGKTLVKIVNEPFSESPEIAAQQLLIHFLQNNLPELPSDFTKKETFSLSFRIGFDRIATVTYISNQRTVLVKNENNKISGKDLDIAFVASKFEISNIGNPRGSWLEIKDGKAIKDDGSDFKNKYYDYTEMSSDEMKNKVLTIGVPVGFTDKQISYYQSMAKDLVSFSDKEKLLNLALNIKSPRFFRRLMFYHSEIKSLVDTFIKAPKTWISKNTLSFVLLASAAGGTAVFTHATDFVNHSLFNKPIAENAWVAEVKQPKKMTKVEIEQYKDIRRELAASSSDESSPNSIAVAQKIAQSQSVKASTWIMKVQLEKNQEPQTLMVFSESTHDAKQFAAIALNENEYSEIIEYYKDHDLYFDVSQIEKEIAELTKVNDHQSEAPAKKKKKYKKDKKEANKKLLADDDVED